ncbi:hypothetical protein GCM10010503_23150 [Streptomyces lucensis JCM 4490]|uniref:Uncharacterized protein n=1 Tax=Streptomyces lucensis JCM 4490 TaxID=1306176 RepID=A0A918J446_9ACTN|nr:hypothetical protein GCM10010503_23150 [Streptomyces lucensis JCM 4490]
MARDGPNRRGPVPCPAVPGPGAAVGVVRPSRRRAWVDPAGPGTAVGPAGRSFVQACPAQFEPVRDEPSSAEPLPDW